MQESFGYRGPEPISRREEEVGEIDRAYARFEDRVLELSGLPPEKARIATAFVLHALEYRMEGNAARHFASSLPPGVEVLLKRNPMRDEDYSGFNRATFFRDVARKLGLPTEKIGGVVSGVLTGVREWMNPEEAAALGNALPEDMRALWREPSKKFRVSREPTPDQAARHNAHYMQSFQGLLRDIKLYGNLDEGLAECAVVAVMTQLDARLMGEGPDLKAQLPKRLTDLLVQADSKPMARPDKFTLREMYGRIAKELQRDEDDVIPVVAAVFHAVKQHITPGEAAQVADQLPKDIAQAWLCA